MAVSDGDLITVMKDMGLVTTVFDERKLSGLRGHLAIGHTRYSTAGSSDWINAQPVFRGVGRAGFGLAHNGNLTNTDALAEQANMLPGLVSSDSDLVAELLARAFPPDGPEATRAEHADDLERALVEVLPAVEGAFSFVLMDADRIIGVRDPNGFRPLCLGRLDPTDEYEQGWVLASESPALDVIGATFIRELEPGEMVVIDGKEVRSERPFPDERIDPRAVHLRVRLLRPARHHPVRQRGPWRPSADGPAPGPPATRRGRPGHGGARLRGTGRRGLRPGLGHPLRTGSGEEPLHRPHLHRPDPGRAGQRGAPEVEPAAREHRRQAGGRGRRLDRPWYHHAGHGDDAARGRGHRDPPPHLLAAVQVALLLRHRHPGPHRAARRRQDPRGDRRVPRRRLARVPDPRAPGRGHRRTRRRLLRRLPDRRLPGARGRTGGHRRAARRARRPPARPRRDGADPPTSPPPTRRRAWTSTPGSGPST